MSIDMSVELAKLSLDDDDVVLIRMATLTPEIGRHVKGIMEHLRIKRYIVLDDKVDVSTLNREDWVAYTRKFFPGLLPGAT